MGIGISERNRMAGGFGFCAGRTASVENGAYHMVLQKYQQSGLPPASESRRCIPSYKLVFGSALQEPFRNQRSCALTSLKLIHQTTIS